MLAQINNALIVAIPNEFHRFFVYLYRELVDVYTPDTWQPRTSNIRSILDEIVKAIDVSRDYPPYRHNITYLLDEVSSLAAYDPVVLNRFPAAEKYIGLLKGVQFKEEKKLENLDELQNQTRVVAGMLKSYGKYAVADLRELLSRAPGGEMRRLNRLTTAVVTLWSLRGYSLPHLREGVNLLLDPAEPDFVKRFDFLAASCSGTPRKFTCRLAVSWAKRLSPQEFPEGSIKFHSASPPELPTPAEAKFYSQTRDTDVLADVTVESVDPTAARQQAEERLADILASLTLYRVQDNFVPRSHVALVIEDGRTPQTVDLDHSRMQYLRNAAEPVEKFSKLIELCNVSDPQTREQITSALQYHRVALTAGTTESRLVNLWIAMECLSRRGKDEAIIEAICHRISPSIAIGNIRKIVSSIGIYVRTFWRPSNVTDFLSLLPRSNEKYVDPADMLDLLLEPDECDRMFKLRFLISSHALLSYRIERARVQLNSPDAVVETLERHRNNVDWQLRRIYRARNDVMHRGRGNSSLSHLVQHLHTYFMVATNNLVHDLLTNSGWNVDVALTHRSILFDHFLSVLKGHRTKPVARTLLLDPSLCLGMASGQAAWPTDVKQAPPKSRNASY